MNYLDYLIGKISYWLWDKKQGGIRLETLNELQQAAQKTPEQLLQLQTEKLNRLMQVANQSSPWYRQQLLELGLADQKTYSFDDLKKLPITTKQDIRNNPQQFLNQQYNVDDLAHAKTGGSTGISLNLFFDKHCQMLRNGAQLYADSFAGFKPGMRVAAIWGNPPTARTFKEKLRWYLLERTIYLDTMDLNPRSMSLFVKRYKSFKPQVIFGHAHSIYRFANYLLEQQITLEKPRGIVATSMMLLQHEREAIEKAFNCLVTNRYGCEEVGLIAVECEQHLGMHINSSQLIVECLDDHHQPVKPGESGKLVITDLNNLGMPLLRYRIEDVGILSSQPCSCGRHLPLLKKLEGRVADFLKKKDGGFVAGVSLVERTLTEIAGIQQMQLIQESLDRIIVNRVRGQEFNASTDTQLSESLHSVFGYDVDIIIRDVAAIAQEKTGKYRFSICKI